MGFDAYIRVSRKGGREGDSYITVDDQRHRISNAALRKGVTLSGFEVVEEDVSGSKKASERSLEQILKRIEAGLSEGLIVAFQDRLSRGSLLEQAGIWDRLEKARARLITDDGLDSADPGQELLFAIRAAIARDQWKRYRANWESAQRSAIERGLHFSAKTPVGYLYTKSGLESDPDLAPVVVGLFERRAQGWNWTKLANWMNAQTGRKANRETIRGIIKNPVYTGVARSGDHVKRNAHEAIVSQKLWDAANHESLKGTKRRGDGSMSAQMLALGLATCANCGHKLQVSASKWKNPVTGKLDREPAYGCKNMHCTERGFISSRKLDPWLKTWALTRPDPSALILIETNSSVAEAAKKFEAAEYDRKLFIGNKELRRLMSAEEYAGELESLNEAVAEANSALRLAEREATSANVTSAIEQWDSWSIDQQREFLAKVIAKLTVRAAKRQKLAVTEQVEIEWATQLGVPPLLN